MSAKCKVCANSGLQKANINYLSKHISRSDAAFILFDSSSVYNLLFVLLRKGRKSCNLYGVSIDFLHPKEVTNFFCFLLFVCLTKTKTTANIQRHFIDVPSSTFWRERQLKQDAKERSIRTD